MKTTSIALLTAAVVIVFSGCNSPARFTRNHADTQAWLAPHTAKASLDVSGNWSSVDWGTTYFGQSGRNVTGSTGEFTVKGVVSGDRAYLTLWDADWCYHTMTIGSGGRGVLTGTWTHEPPPAGKARSGKQYPVEFRRVN